MGQTYTNAKEAKSLLTQLTNTLTILIQNLYGYTGLAGIVLAMAIESCCIPLPSEIVMPLAGIIIASFYTAHPLHLPGTSPSFPLWVNLILAALAGSLGCLLGSMAAYGIGVSGGSDFHGDSSHGPAHPGAVFLPQEAYDELRRRRSG